MDVSNLLSGAELYGRTIEAQSDSPRILTAMGDGLAGAGILFSAVEHRRLKTCIVFYQLLRFLSF